MIARRPPKSPPHSKRSIKIGSAPILTLLVVLIKLSGCAASNPTRFLSLSRAASPRIPNLEKIDKVVEVEGVYSIKTSQDGIFGSGIEECPIPPKATPASLNRQLYVGFDELKITNQERFKTGQFTSEATAQVGNNPIYMMAVSTKSKNCIRDVVFWKANPEEFQPETIEVCKKIAARILALEEVR